MGCDIHTFVEARDPRTEEEKWLFIHKPGFRSMAESRYYYRFMHLANVRCNTGEARFQPKGFPDNASDLVQIEYETWGYDAHSASWMYLPQFVGVCLATEKSQSDEPIDIVHWQLLMSKSTVSYTDIEAVFDSKDISIPLLSADNRCRVVYWFDN